MGLRRSAMNIQNRERWGSNLFSQLVSEALAIVKHTISTRFMSYPLRGALILALLSACGLLKPMAASANDLQSGDILIGAAVIGSPLEGFVGGVFLLRNGQISIFCQSPEDSFDPSYWGIPDGMIADSQGRVVFLAPLSQVSGNSGWGLLRCDGIGSTPEKLAIFPQFPTSQTVFPVPYPGQLFSAVVALHLTVLNTINLNDLSAGVTSQDAYNLVLGGSGSPQSVRYLATDQIWETGDDIVTNAGLPDVIGHSGATYSLNYNGDLEKLQDPLRIEVSGNIGGTSFSAILSLFASENTIHAPITYDTITPMIPSGCPPPVGGENSNMPVNRSGGFAPYQGGGIVYDEFTGYGLVSITNYAPLYPFMANIDETLLDNPGDPTVYFQDSYMGCTAQPYLQFVPPLPWYDPVTGFPNSPDLNHPASSTVGILATQQFAGDVIEMVTGNIATIVASGLNYPTTVAGYPNGYSAGLSTTIVLRVDSPVNVLITDPNGKQLGVDALGNTHNDFTGTNVNPLTGGSQNFNNGFDSGPGEPRFFGIKNPIPGMYNVQSVGTGSGPYTVHVYSVNTSKPAGQAISTSGIASVGSTGSESFTLDTLGNIAFACASDVSSEIGVTRSGYGYSIVTKLYAQTITLTNNSASTIAGPISLVLDNLSSNATLFNAAGTTSCAAPSGSPYVTISGPLSPGESATVVLQFTDPTKAGITYTTRVLAGGVSE